MVEGERGKLKDASAGKIGERAGRVVNKRKMAKHFTLQIADGSFDYQRNQLQIDEEALFDGNYVIRTAEPQRADRLRGGGARLQAAEGQRTRVSDDEDAA
jgi:hypothetical protein